MNDTIIRLPAVKQICGLSRSSIYEGMAAGTFPKQVKIGPRSVGWKVSDMSKWIETRISGNGHKS